MYNMVAVPRDMNVYQTVVYYGGSLQLTRYSLQLNTTDCAVHDRVNAKMRWTRDANIMFDHVKFLKTGNRNGRTHPVWTVGRHLNRNPEDLF